MKSRSLHNSTKKAFTQHHEKRDPPTPMCHVIIAPYLLLVISSFFKVCIFFPSTNVIVPCVSYGTWNSISITLFVNKHDYTINKEWRQEAISFRLQKETSSLNNLEQCLKHFGFKFQRFYIMAAFTFPVPGIGFSNCFICSGAWHRFQ